MDLRQLRSLGAALIRAMRGYGLFGRIGATGSTATFAGISPIGFGLPISLGGFGRPISPRWLWFAKMPSTPAAPATRVLWRRYGL
jgi:hypothetical protein